MIRILSPGANQQNMIKYNVKWPIHTVIIQYVLKIFHNSSKIDHLMRKILKKSHKFDEV